MELASQIWEQLGYITEYEEFKKCLKFADDSEIKRKGPYVGQFNGEDQYHGFGRFSKRGFIYEGMWENGEKDGWGRLIQPNGTYYEGNFQDNMFDGKGKLSILNLRMHEI